MATLKDIAELAAAAVDALNALDQALDKAREEGGLTDFTLPDADLVEKATEHYPYGGEFPGNGKPQSEILLAAAHLTFPVWFESFDPFDDDVLTACEGLLPDEEEG